MWSSKVSSDIESAAYKAFAPIQSSPGVLHLALEFADRSGHMQRFKVRAKSLQSDARRVVLTKDSCPADEMIIVPGDKREGILQELNTHATRAALALAAARDEYRSGRAPTNRT